MRRFSDELFERLDVGQAGVAAVAGAVHRPDRLPGLLARWFATQWHMIRATVPLLELAASRIERGPASDFNRRLAAYYRRHADEERHHDRILLRDLALLGVTEERLLEAPPAMALTALVGSQYYLIDFFDAAAFLGYVALLEGYPATAEQVETLVRASGVSPRAWSCYRMHATVDPQHRADLVEVLDGVPADARLRRAIVANGLRSAELLCQALEEVLPAAA